MTGPRAQRHQADRSDAPKFARESSCLNGGNVESRRQFCVLYNRPCHILQLVQLAVLRVSKVADLNGPF